MPRSPCRPSCSPAIAIRSCLARHGEKLAAAAPGVKLVVLPGFGHMLHHAAADRVVAAVDELAGAL